MKKTILILLCLSMSYYLMSQETVKQKEIGLAFSNLDNFGLTYRTGTNKALWRLNTLFISGSNTDNVADSLVDKNSNIGFNVKIGREYRKVLADKLEMRFGADLLFNYKHYKSEYEDKSVNNYYKLNEDNNYWQGFNLIFGFNYKLDDNFVMGVEILPSFSYLTGTSKVKHNNTFNNDESKANISGFSYGLSNTSALLSFAYRF